MEHDCFDAQLCINILNVKDISNIAIEKQLGGFTALPGSTALYGFPALRLYGSTAPRFYGSTGLHLQK